LKLFQADIMGQQDAINGVQDKPAPLAARSESWYQAGSRSLLNRPLKLRTALEILVLANVGHGQESIFEGDPLARLSEQRLPLDATMFLLHRIHMRARLLFQLLDDLFFDLSDNELWHI
jgi:hypothetical protein